MIVDSDVVYLPLAPLFHQRPGSGVALVSVGVIGDGHTVDRRGVARNPRRWSFFEVYALQGLELIGVSLLRTYLLLKPGREGVPGSIVVTVGGRPVMVLECLLRRSRFGTGVRVGALPTAPGGGTARGCLLGG